MIFRRPILVVPSMLAMLLTYAPAADKVEFNRDIRPILSENCFYCHGPDSAQRKKDLRLDRRNDAMKAGAIAPGDVAKSKLVERIFTDDADDMMPPPKSNRHLTDAQRQILKAWIEQGGEYEPLWDFIPLKPVPVPTTAATHASPIDALVESGLQKRGLHLQPEADRHTLIRRLSFDLTGLPPKPEDVQAFINDTRPDAYEKLVDHLLQSPRYGERMAVDWLDISRYADSYGFQVDREREVWPWRDWVIKAFNQNLPFDKFVTWQIAGDLLPQATDEQVLATAFNRLHQQESEGGSVEEEYRVEYICDRVQTFATAFLGLTFQCSRCHDHKFDPITQRDYYSLFAMFQNIDEAGLYSFYSPSTTTPALDLKDAATRKNLAELHHKVQDLEKQAAVLRESRRAAFDAWWQANPQKIAFQGELGHFTFDALNKDKLANEIKDGKPATLKGENQLVAGHRGQAVQFTGDDPVELPFGNFERHEPFSVSLWLRTPDVKDRAVVFHRSRAWTDSASRGYELLIEEGKLKWSVIHFWPGNAISIRAKNNIPINTWTQVTVTYDGSSRANGLHLYINGSLATVEVIRDNLTRQTTGDGGNNIVLAQRTRDRGFKNGAIDEFRVFGRELSSMEAAALHDQPLTDKGAWYEYYLSSVDAEWKKHLDALKAARAEEGKATDALKEIMVMRELPQPKKAYILFRGEYNQHRAEVHPDTPEALPPLPAGAPRNRLGLAQWLTSRENPLLARVTANRFWLGLFGNGLVKTVEDFGSQGAQPLYPELLNWLALRFIDSGWNVKALLKTMVMSQTYRQRSLADPKTMEDDPENDWLARGPRFRLPAEMIRDNALAAAGLLNLKEGGPPVNPYEMSEAFKPASPSLDGVYRRSLYTDWRRTSPPPAMLTFDAPRRAVCTGKRERTESPLQALILLNGTQYVETARVLGEKLLHDTKGNTDAMIDRGFQLCLSRSADAREISIMRRLYDEQLALFKAHPNEATALLKTGFAPQVKDIDPAQAAAATVLAQALLNHDACVVKR